MSFLLKQKSKFPRNHSHCVSRSVVPLDEVDGAYARVVHAAKHSAFCSYGCQVSWLPSVLLHSCVVAESAVLFASEYPHPSDFLFEHVLTSRSATKVSFVPPRPLGE